MDAPTGSTGGPHQQLRAIDRLRENLERNDGACAGFGERLAAVLAEDLWRGMPAGPGGDEPFTSLGEFIEAAPPYGLGSTVGRIRALARLSALSAASSAAIELTDRVQRRLDDLLGADPEHDPVARDARTFGTFAEAGSWAFGLMVARSVRPGRGGGRPGVEGSPSEENTAVADA